MNELVSNHSSILAKKVWKVIEGVEGNELFSFITVK